MSQELSVHHGGPVLPAVSSCSERSEETGGYPVNKDSSPEDLLSEIERMRAEMYRLAEDQDTPEAVASVRKMSESLDVLIYRFMCYLRDRDANESQHHAS